MIMGWVSKVSSMVKKGEQCSQDMETKDMKSKRKGKRFMKKTDSGHMMVPSLDITPKKVLASA